MSDKLQIVISGNATGASSAFKTVTADAQKMGQSVEQMGEKSGRSLQQVNQRAAAFGAALGGATLLMADFAKAAADDAASQARLEQSVTNTGAAVDDYSASLEAAIKAGQQKAFSDDQTRDALVKLNLATNDTQKSIEQLGLAMDLSRARGISLSQSAELIGKVYQGSYGALTRMGIVLDETATSAEALAEVQKRVAGQAQTYASSDVGQVAKLRDQFDEFTESLGAHAGQLQTIALLLPTVRAGYIALSGALAGLGAGPVLAGLAVLAAAGAYSYDLNTNRGGPAENKTAGFFAGAAGFLNTITPGNAFSGIQSQFRGVIEGGEISKLTSGMYYTPPGTRGAGTDKYAVQQLKAFGILPADFDGTIAQAATYINAQATYVGMGTGQYVQTHTKGVYDPITDRYATPYDYSVLYRNRTYAANANQVYDPRIAAAATRPAYVSPYGPQGIYNPYVGTAAEFGAGREAALAYRAGGTGAVANDVSGMGGAPVVLSQANQDLANAANAAQYSAALRDQYGAFAKLVEGIDLAKGASMAFKATQDDLIAGQDVWNQQLGEYSSQQASLTAGRDILLQRQADGVELTKEEQDLLDNYPELYERVTGGMDDATVQGALLSAQYIENMKTGDELNRTMQDSTESTANLVDIIRELILNLEGVPPETRARLELEGADSALAELQSIVAHLNGLNGQTATFFVNEVRTGISIGSPSGVGPTVRHGGVVGYDNGGVVIHAGEAGPEYMSFANGGSAWAMNSGLYNVPRGTYVTPAPASVGKSSNGLHFNGPVSITVVANDPRQMAQAINEWAVGSSRS